MRSHAVTATCVLITPCAGIRWECRHWTLAMFWSHHVQVSGENVVTGLWLCSDHTMCRYQVRMSLDSGYVLITPCAGIRWECRHWTLANTSLRVSQVSQNSKMFIPNFVKIGSLVKTIRLWQTVLYLLSVPKYLFLCEIRRKNTWALANVYAFLCRAMDETAVDRYIREQSTNRLLSIRTTICADKWRRGGRQEGGLAHSLLQPTCVRLWVPFWMYVLILYCSNFTVCVECI
jgi:hypothetical protein